MSDRRNDPGGKPSQRPAPPAPHTMVPVSPGFDRGVDYSDIKAMVSKAKGKKKR